MNVFHGTNLIVEKPRIMNRFKTLDFGEGFYTIKKSLRNQVVFCNQRVLDCLVFVKSYQVEEMP